MYTQVKSDEQLREFDSIWTRSWEEKGFELEYAMQADRYLIKDRRDNRYVATAELKPYVGAEAEIYTAFPFSSLPHIRDNLNRVYEVDKVSILKEYRGYGTLNAVLFTVIFYAARHNVKYYVALIDPYLFETLDQGFHLPVEQVGEPVYYKGEYAIPTVIDMEYYLEHNLIKKVMPRPKKLGLMSLHRLAWLSVYRMFYFRHRMLLKE